jgi:uncharacterized protein (DUF934 family)
MAEQPVEPKRRVLIGDAFVEDIDDGKSTLALAPGDDVRAAQLDGVQRVVLSFPKAGDGRAFTQARLLREQLGYRGRLRATGEVLVDWIWFMRRCGIDEIVLRHPHEEAFALEKLRTFTVKYQPAADEAQPLWRSVARR